jgi:hypothetical protein
MGFLVGGAAGADAAAGELADASLVGFSLDDAVVAHRLVMRVARERLAADGELAAVMAGAVQVLAGLTDGMSEAWRDPGGVRDLAQQVSAVVTHSADVPGGVGEMPADLLNLRLRLIYLLNALGDSTGLVILAAEPLVADSERVLGADHPDSLTSRNNLATAFQDAGRTGEAITLYERTLDDFERLLGADHPDTLGSRNNLAMAFQDAGGQARRSRSLSARSTTGSGCWAPTTRTQTSSAGIWLR